ncbi:MAG: helix-turn-helix transcriptional regulator [Clostridia bacterium]|nr:helix-turn-helix transcriptional regulator [Clostridia bacterium]
MNEPSDFGKYLKEKRLSIGINQTQLAAYINKTGQYISNIEKGKNNAPPDSSDIEKLIIALSLSEEEARKFRRKAAADRNRLPENETRYLLSHPALIELIDFGIKKKLSNRDWKDILTRIEGGIPNG